MGGDPLRDPDSPINSLIRGFAPPELSHPRVDYFPERVASERRVSEEIKDVRRGIVHGDKDSLAAAREALNAIAEKLAGDEDTPASVRLELMLAYRATEGWEKMFETYETFPPELKNRRIPCEQYAMAFNRLARKDHRHAPKALKVLAEVEQRFGVSSETSGLIGRVHKDLWQKARETNDVAAPAHLKEAIAAYARGFNADLRVFCPGINYTTLLSARGKPKEIETLDFVPRIRKPLMERAGTS